jgi:hypothetical protein
VASFYPESLAALRAAGRRRFGIDAAASLLAAAGLALLLSQGAGWLRDRFPAQTLFSIGVPAQVASAFPAAAAVAAAVRTMILSAAALALVAVLANRVGKRSLLVPLGALALTAALPSGLRTPGEFLLAYGIALLEGGAALRFCRLFARANYLAYALTLWVLALRPAMMELLGSGNGRLEAHGLVIAAVAAASLLWAAAPALRRASAKA